MATEGFCRRVAEDGGLANGRCGAKLAYLEGRDGKVVATWCWRCEEARPIPVARKGAADA